MEDEIGCGGIIRSIKADKNILSAFTRDELRRYAKFLGVPRGHYKADTIVHLSTSGKARICATLDYTQYK